MKNFNDLIKENGFLSEDGKKFFEPLNEVLKKIIYSPELRGATDDQIKLVGSIMATQIADAISQKVQRKSSSNAFQNMTDPEFEMYLKNKYGDKWMLKTLTAEEFERCPVPSVEEIRNIIEGGRKARMEAEKAMSIPNIDYKRRYR